MASSAPSARGHERVERICKSERNALQLRIELLDAIASQVRFDAYAWLLTDPHTWVGSAPLADVPCVPELPRAIRLKYLTEVNRWTRLDATPVASLVRATEGDRSRSLYWRELLARYDIDDLASVVFTDRFGCWGFLDLWRSSSSGAFSEAETDFLTGIVNVITHALRRSQAETFRIAPQGNGERLGPVVLMLSAVLEVRAQTPDTDAYLRTLVPPSLDRAPIPAGAYNVGAQLLAVEAGVDDHPPWARVHLSEGRWVTLRAARIGGAVDAVDQQDISVTIEDTSPLDRADLFARAFGLTARERELLRHLASGADTRELADRMFLSEHTVQDHLKSIFAKTSTRTRSTLLSAALGT